MPGRFDHWSGTGPIHDERRPRLASRPRKIERRSVGGTARTCSRRINKTGRARAFGHRARLEFDRRRNLLSALRIQPSRDCLTSVHPTGFHSVAQSILKGFASAALTRFALIISRPWLTAAALLILRKTTSRARLGLTHILRCSIYSSDVLFWVARAICLVIAGSLFSCACAGIFRYASSRTLGRF